VIFLKPKIFLQAVEEVIFYVLVQVEGEGKWEERENPRLDEWDHRPLEWDQ
jgi:hypothetical protein